MLVLRDALTQPLLYLSAYFEQHRSEYYDHRLLTSQNGDLMPWLSFFLRGVRRQARDSEERTVRLVELQHELRSELLDEGRPNSVVRLAEQLFSIPVVTAARVETMIGVTARPLTQRSTPWSSAGISSRPLAASDTGSTRLRPSSTPCTAPSRFPSATWHRLSPSDSPPESRSASFGQRIADEY